MKTKGDKEGFGNDGSIILIVVKVVWLHTYPQTSQINTFSTCCLLYVNDTPINMLYLRTCYGSTQQHRLILNTLGSVKEVRIKKLYIDRSHLYDILEKTKL